MEYQQRVTVEDIVEFLENHYDPESYANYVRNLSDRAEFIMEFEFMKEFQSICAKIGTDGTNRDVYIKTDRAWRWKFNTPDHPFEKYLRLKYTC